MYHIEFLYRNSKEIQLILSLLWIYFSYFKNRFYLLFVFKTTTKYRIVQNVAIFYVLNVF